jgi:tetratricopeptide (TPR) repeat protein
MARVSPIASDVLPNPPGAISIATLLAVPRATGLVRRAIMQSGAARMVMSASAARRVSWNLARKLGVAATRDALAAVPVDRVLEAQLSLQDDLTADPDPRRWSHEVVNTRMLWQPVIDGRVLPTHPLERIAAGAAAAVDVLIGTNTDEHRLFMATTGALEHITEEALAAAISSYGLPVETTLAAQPEAAASMFNAIGYVYLQIGDFPEAERRFRQALARLSDSRVKDPKAISDSMDNLAGVLAEMNRYDEAEKLLKLVIAERTQSQGPEASQTLTAIGNLGFLYEKGSGVKMDKPKAVALYQHGCDGTMCQHSNLGGTGPEADHHALEAAQLRGHPVLAVLEVRKHVVAGVVRHR